MPKSKEQWYTQGWRDARDGREYEPDVDGDNSPYYATGYEDAEHARSLGRDIEWSREDGK